MNFGSLWPKGQLVMIQKRFIIVISPHGDMNLNSYINIPYYIMLIFTVSKILLNRSHICSMDKNEQAIYSCDQKVTTDMTHK